MPIHGIKAVYRPFSFQERMAPLQMMKEEYDKINEGLATLGETASQFYQYLDPASRQQVDAYNAQLNQVAGSLASDGMKAVSRNALNNLRRTYTNQIKPIQDAAQTVGTIQAQIREMAMKDPTLIVQSVPTVSELMQDPNAKPSLVSGAQLMKEGNLAALTLPGVSYDQLARYLQGDTTAIPDLERVADRIASDYNLTDEQAKQWVQRGIMSGLGERATQLDIKQQEMDMQLERDMAKLRYSEQQQNWRFSQSRKDQRRQEELNERRLGFVRDADGNLIQTQQSLDEATRSRIASQGYDPDSPFPTWDGRTSRSGSGSQKSPQVPTNQSKTRYTSEGVADAATGAAVDAGTTNIGDIKNASIGEQAFALAHANIVRLSDLRKAGSRKTQDFDEATVRRLISQYGDQLNKDYTFKSKMKSNGEVEAFVGERSGHADEAPQGTQTGNSSDQEFGVTGNNRP